MNAVRKLFNLLSAAEQRQLGLLSLAMLVLAMVQVAGIGSLGPFMALVADPSVVERQPILQSMYEVGGFSTIRAFVIAVGVGAFILIVLGNAFKLVTLYAIHRFVGTCRASLGLRLFRQYLHQPYSFFLDHNTSEMSKSILTEIDLVTNGVLRGAMDMVAHGFVSLAIFGYLFATNPAAALSAAALLLIVYAIIYAIIRPRLMRHGDEMGSSNEKRFKATSEAFGAIKELKILGKESTFEDLYHDGARRFAWSHAGRSILMIVPKHVLEAFAFGLMVLWILSLLVRGEGVATILPLVSVYGFAAYRLLPALQSVFSGASQVRYYGHTVDALYAVMKDLKDWATEHDRQASGSRSAVIPMENTVAVEGVSFRYPTSPVPVLSDISLRIGRNTTVAFVGTTGCGKTTLVDLLMGLLEPSSGSITVDGNVLDCTTAAWQRNFGYVPQQIFLSDDSVAANIAFGVPEDDRDHHAVERAARAANLHEFVSGELRDGYDTFVGERGIRLSGGQRQRVGIARALYHDPPILIMDEATSALDSVTEDAVLEAINELMHRKTIVLIAHRLTTVQSCDMIYVLEHGEVKATGTYQQLVQNDSRFRAMAKAAPR